MRNKIDAREQDTHEHNGYYVLLISDFKRPLAIHLCGMLIIGYHSKKYFYELAMDINPTV